ncbi:TetR/AcrR family transcriptional regulator [Leucobacter sp. M11]|uniref:TetR/AcrR family transcriptional regulator n=1 Tax=Leucobacter sp. M11 TaxID=2993565 RepID=UPI002D7F3E4B|nr:TetR/AcrR family transcriptional regulator [Leucobacter sp. M11]MEB4616414.1 TetR/AcrR family transcriptional regulator [Leucobacter sp. M11]
MSASTNTPKDLREAERQPHDDTASALAAPPRRSLRTAQKAITKQLLIDAAIRVFLRTGYHAASIDQITSEAGASRATFYLHFGTKADVLEDFLDLATARFAEQYAALTEVLKEPAPEQLRGWLLTAMDHWPLIADVMRPVFEATAAHPGLYARFFPDDLPGNQEMARALWRSGLVVDLAEATEVATVMFAPLYHYMRVFLRGEPFPRELIADLISVSWMALLSARGNAEVPRPT